MYEHYPFKNEPLPYAYGALEPYIDMKTMQLHHNRHLQAYVDNLNTALKDYPEYQELTLQQLICNYEMLPESIRISVKNNAGGVYNHRFYFEGMTSVSVDNPQKPREQLAEGIIEGFGNYDGFVTEFTKAAMSVFGSGYAWLVMNRKGRLEIVTTANQEAPICEGLCPIMNIDVWEHSYYLKHYNVRKDYIGDWFAVTNWNKALENYCYCRIKQQLVVGI